MRRTAIAVAVLLAFGPLLRADKPPDKKEAATPAEQYQALVRDYQKARDEAQQALKDAKTDDEKKKAQAEVRKHGPAEVAPRFVELARKHPKDPAAVDALTWVANNSSSSLAQGDGLEVLARYHAADQSVGLIVEKVGRYGTPTVDRLLRAVLENNPDRALQGRACYQLALNLKNQAGRDREKSPANKEANILLDRVIKKYDDVPYRGDTLGEAARTLRNLAVGKTVPEIRGEDVDGQVFKLSDYRGKVVLLDFWGNW